MIRTFALLMLFVLPAIAQQAIVASRPRLLMDGKRASQMSVWKAKSPYYKPMKAYADNYARDASYTKTNLAQDLTGTDRTMVVTDGAHFPSGPFDVVLGQEVMKIGGRTGNTFQIKTDNSSLRISSISNANPATVTFTGTKPDWFGEGQQVCFTGATGSWSALNTCFRAIGLNANSFQLYSISYTYYGQPNATINSMTFGAYSGQSVSMTLVGRGAAPTPGNYSTIKSHYGTKDHETVWRLDGMRSNPIGGSFACAVLDLGGESAYRDCALFQNTLNVATHGFWYSQLNWTRWAHPFIAYLYDWEHEHLTSGDIKAFDDMISAAVDWNLSHLYMGASQSGMSANLQSAQVQLVIFYSIATKGDWDKAEQSYAAAHAVIEKYLIPSMASGLMSGGAAIEGSEYESEVFHQSINMLDAIQYGTGENLWAKVPDWPSRWMHYLLTSTLPTSTNTSFSSTHHDTAGTTNFADYAFNDYHRVAAAHMMDWFARYGDQTNAGYLKRWLEKTITPPVQDAGYWAQNYVWFDPTIPTLDYTKSGVSPIFVSGGNGRLSARTNWSGSASWVQFFIDSVNWDHVLGGALSYSYFRNGQWLTRELTSYGAMCQGPWPGTNNAENANAGSRYKNTIVMNGHGMPVSGEGVNPSGPITTDRKEVGKDNSYVYARGNASAYVTSPDWAIRVPGSNNYSNKYIRDFLYILPDLVVIADEVGYTRATPNATEWNSIFQHSPEIEGQRITEKVGSQKLVQDVVVPTSAKISTTDLKTECAKLAGYRMKFTTGASATSDWALQVLQGMSAGDNAAPATSLTTTNANVAQVGSSYVVGAVKGKVPQLPITYQFTGSPKHYLMGFAPSTQYTVTIGGKAQTIQSTAAGLLIFDSAGANGTVTIAK